MEINLEKSEFNSIQAYSDTHVIINQQNYAHSIIVNQDGVHSWDIRVKNISLPEIQPLIDLDPEVILLGYSTTQIVISPEISVKLSQHRIGIECMSLGAACRTFNILLNEKRRVVLGLIFNLL